MRICAPEVVREREAVKVTARVERRGLTQQLWYSVPHRYEEYLLPGRVDSFVLGLLLPAMRDGEDIHADGLMSEKLFFNLTRHYSRLLSIAAPALRPVRLLPGQLEGRAPAPGPGVAVGFSAGVDSFSALADHFLGPVPDGFRVTHLFFDNVGSHGIGGRRLFEERYARILALADELSLPVVKVDSNLDEVMAGFDHEFDHGIRNMSAALILQRLFRRYLYASTHRFEDCNVRGARWMSILDPAVLHLLSTEATECVSVGCQYSRVEKTARIAELPITWRHLDVCIAERVGNCSRCWKCCRTMLTLEMLGKLELYRGVFDLDIWKRNRVDFMGRVLARDFPLAREIVESAPRYRWRFPVRSRLLAVRYRAAAALYRAAGRIRHHA